MGEAVSDILRDRHVREQSETLQNISGATAGERNVNRLRGIEQDSIPDRNLPGVGRGQSGNAVEQSCLSGSGGAEENGEACGSIECDIQRKITCACAMNFPNDALETGIAVRWRSPGGR